MGASARLESHPHNVLVTVVKATVHIHALPVSGFSLATTRTSSHAQGILVYLGLPLGAYVGLVGRTPHLTVQAHLQ